MKRRPSKRRIWRGEVEDKVEVDEEEIKEEEEKDGEE